MGVTSPGHIRANLLREAVRHAGAVAGRNGVSFRYKDREAKIAVCEKRARDVVALAWRASGVSIRLGTMSREYDRGRFCALINALVTAIKEGRAHYDMINRLHKYVLDQHRWRQRGGATPKPLIVSHQIIGALLRLERGENLITTGRPAGVAVGRS